MSTSALCQQAIQTNIITDGSLGERVTLTGGRVIIPDNLGTLQGRNLFHSFEQFDVGTDAQAISRGPGDVAIVISRVTGGKVSQIDGRLSSEVGNANVWLINPSGIVFGQGAEIDVPADFHVSTAHQVQFADGGVFSATDPDGSTFSIAPPERFGFLGGNTGDVVVRGLEIVGEGQTLPLVGGDVTVEDNLSLPASAPVITAPGVNLVLAATQGAVSVSPLDVTSGNIDMATTAGTVLINSGIRTGGYDADAYAGGSVSIAAGGNVGINGFIDTRAFDAGGSVSIAAGGNVGINDYGFIDTGGSDAGGNVSIFARSVTFHEQARISAEGYYGSSGVVQIDADVLITDSLSYQSAIRGMFTPAIGEIQFVGIGESFVITDGTIGAISQLDGVDLTIGSDLGLVQGTNLFHSFERFEVGTGARVTFTGPDTVEDVIARVTGGSASQIDGRLSSEVGNADLWLINPSGIVFGDDAIVDVPGGFHVATAHEVGLRDGGVFSAADPANSSLTMGSAESFGFLGGNTGDVVVRGLEFVGERQTLSLIGGDVTLGDNVSFFASAPVITASGTKVFLAATQGAVSVNPLDVTSGNIDMATAAGTVLINSGIRTGGYDADAYAGGSVSIAAGGNVGISGFRGINIGGYGAGGSISIAAGGDVGINGSGYIDTGGYGAGGSVSIAAAGNIGISSFRGINTASFGAGGSYAGNITMSSDSIQIDGSTITANGQLAGRASEVRLTANQGALLSTNASTISVNGNQADAGSIRLMGNDVNVQDSALTARGTNSAGGEIIILANRSLVLNGSEFATSGDLSNRDSSTIELSAPFVQLLNGTAILSLSDDITDETSGDATIVANDRLDFR